MIRRFKQDLYKIMVMSTPLLIKDSINLNTLSNFRTTLIKRQNSPCPKRTNHPYSKPVSILTRTVLSSTISSNIKRSNKIKGTPFLASVKDILNPKPKRITKRSFSPKLGTTAQSCAPGRNLDATKL